MARFAGLGADTGTRRARETSSRLEFGMECEEDKPTSTVLKQMHSTSVL
jgi:hypothetical protein